MRGDPHAADAAQDDVNVTSLLRDPHAADAAQDDVNVTSLRGPKGRGNLIAAQRAEFYHPRNLKMKGRCAVVDYTVAMGDEDHCMIWERRSETLH